MAMWIRPAFGPGSEPMPEGDPNEWQRKIGQEISKIHQAWITSIRTSADAEAFTFPSRTIIGVAGRQAGKTWLASYECAMSDQWVNVGKFGDGKLCTSKEDMIETTIRQLAVLGVRRTPLGFVLDLDTLPSEIRADAIALMKEMSTGRVATTVGRLHPMDVVVKFYHSPPVILILTAEIKPDDNFDGKVILA